MRVASLWIPVTALWLVVPRVQALPIAMDPGTLQIGSPEIGYEVHWTLLDGDTDTFTTRLTFRFDVQTYTLEPSGRITFDAPILTSLDYGDVEIFYVDGVPGDGTFSWFYASHPPPYSSQRTLALELQGVPTTVDFSGVSASFTIVPEPSSALLVATWLVGLGLLRHRRAWRP